MFEIIDTVSLQYCAQRELRYEKSARPSKPPPSSLPISMYCTVTVDNLHRDSDHTAILSNAFLIDTIQQQEKTKY